MDKDSLRNNILKTIVFFDLFDYPLTAWEVWKFLAGGSGKIELKDILKNLESDYLRAKISQKEGFYFLTGRGAIINERKARYNFTARKVKLALRLVQAFKLIPWIKMVAISNLIGSHNLREKSDIDLFIISEKKRIWLVRFFCVGLTKLLNLRPRPGRTRDTICLNFYLSESAMNMEKLLLRDDIYFVYWLAGLVPLYSFNQTYEKLMAANGWLGRRLVNWQPLTLPARSRLDGKRNEIYYALIDFLLGRTEKFFMKLQLSIMPKEMKNKINGGTEVVTSEEIIKLHVKDRREEFKKKFNNRLREMGEI